MPPISNWETVRKYYYLPVHTNVNVKHCRL